MPKEDTMKKEMPEMFVTDCCNVEVKMIDPFSHDCICPKCGRATLAHKTFKTSMEENTISYYCKICKTYFPCGFPEHLDNFMKENTIEEKITIKHGLIKITTRVGDSPDWIETIPIEHYNVIRRQALEKAIECAPKKFNTPGGSGCEEEDAYNQAIEDFKKNIKNLYGSN